MSKNARRRRTTAPRRVAGWAITTALLLVTLFCVAWIAPSLFGFSRYVITGESMTGTIDKGSVVFEKPVGVDDLEVGDIITYQPPADAGTTSLVTHRIIKIEPAEGGGKLFTTKGDHNPQADPWHFKLVDQEQPVVRSSVPYVGWVFIALADRTTRMMLIGVPAALIALHALGQLLGAFRRTEEKTDAEVEAEPAVTELWKSEQLAVAEQ